MQNSLEHENHEKAQFRDLYRKSIDRTEYLSAKDREWIDKNISKHPEIVEELEDKVKSMINVKRNVTSGNNMGICQSPSVGMAMIKAKRPIFEEKSVGYFRLSVDTIYDGQLVKGKPNGEGKVINLRTNQVLYEGSVKDGAYHGKGKQFVNNILYEDGIFHNGLISEGIRYMPQGSIYSGQFTKNEYDGKGRIVLPNGFCIRSYFSNGSVDLLSTVTITPFNAKNSVPIRIDGKSSDAFIQYDLIGYRCYETHDCHLVYYYNGDVFVGIWGNEPIRGYLYSFKNNRFKEMIIGDISGIPKFIPDMIVDSSSDYKYFVMRQPGVKTNRKAN